MASVWQLTLLIYPGKTSLSGVILDRGTSTSTASARTLRNAFAIASSYFRKTRSGSSLRAEWGGSSYTTQTDNRGSFYIEAELPLNQDDDLKLFLDDKPLPFDPEVRNIYEVGDKNDLIISDIDDTVLISHTNQRLKSVITTVFRTYTQRKPVQSTSKIFEAIGRQSDYFFVSRSEYNLFPLLANFMKHNELPRGPLFLTPFISFGELIQNKKDPEFKIKTINSLLDHAAHENIYLFGDDTQHDLHVYAEVAKIHGDRIKRIFIRQTEPGTDRRESSVWEELNENSEKINYYNEHSDLDMIVRALTQ